MLKIRFRNHNTSSVDIPLGGGEGLEGGADGGNGGVDGADGRVDGVDGGVEAESPVGTKDKLIYLN